MIGIADLILEAPVSERLVYDKSAFTLPQSELLVQRADSGDGVEVWFVKGDGWGDGADEDEDEDTGEEDAERASTAAASNKHTTSLISHSTRRMNGRNKPRAEAR